MTPARRPVGLVLQWLRADPASEYERSALRGVTFSRRLGSRFIIIVDNDPSTLIGGRLFHGGRV